MITLIWGESFNGVIGLEDKLPWGKHKDDMKHFVRKTKDQTVVMGRKTFDSIGRKPLPNRKNIVLTRNPEFYAKGVIVIDDYKNVLKLAKRENVIVIGGKEIYDLFMPYASKIFKTVINSICYGDTEAPKVAKFEWSSISSKLLGENTDDIPYYIIEMFRGVSMDMVMGLYLWDGSKYNCMHKSRSLDVITSEMCFIIRELNFNTKDIVWNSSKDAVWNVEFGSPTKHFKLVWEY